MLDYLQQEREVGLVGVKRDLQKNFSRKQVSIKLVYDSKEKSIAQICEIFKVSTATLYKCLRFVEGKEQKITIKKPEE